LLRNNHTPDEIFMRQNFAHQEIASFLRPSILISCADAGACERNKANPMTAGIRFITAPVPISENCVNILPVAAIILTTEIDR
jgi:hypothetical protein